MWLCRRRVERLRCGRLGMRQIESGRAVSPAEPAKSSEARLGRVAQILGHPRQFRDPQIAVPDVAKTHKGRANEQECEGDKRQPQCPRRRWLAKGLGRCHVNMLCHGSIRRRKRNRDNANPDRASPKGKDGFSNLPQIPWDSPRKSQESLQTPALGPVFRAIKTEPKRANLSG